MIEILMLTECFLWYIYRFKRGGKGFYKGGPDRIGLGFEEGSSKNTSSSDPLPEYLTSNSSVKTRTDISGKYSEERGKIGLDSCF